MKLNLNKINQLDSEQIYNMLLPVINEIRSSFKYIEISDVDFYELVLKEISDSKKTYTGDQKYIDFIKKKITFQLSERVKELVVNSKTVFNVLNNYINQKFITISSYDDAIKYFEELSGFFKTYGFIPNPDLLIELINKNASFVKMLDLVFNKYSSQIVFGRAKDIFDDFGNRYLLYAE